MTMPAKSPRADGQIWVVLSWASLCLILAMMAILTLLVCWNSFHALWPNRIEQVRLSDGTSFLGFRTNADISPEGAERIQYKIANRELHNGSDFCWIPAADIAAIDTPQHAVHLVRRENGDFLGFPAGEGTPQSFRQHIQSYQTRWRCAADPVQNQLSALGNEWQRTHLAALKAEYEKKQAVSTESLVYWSHQLYAAQEREKSIKAESEILMAELVGIKNEFATETLALVTADGVEKIVPLASIVDISFPNDMHLFQRILRFFINSWNLLSQYPREANTEGGIFPALFGTVMLVFIMAISAFPLGVAAGIYLREYAKDGILSRTARIAVNNLAGVPSIVYGIFGLGFFIYGLGGSVDEVLYPERVAAGISTYGAGGIIWSALTLGLLTLPVVIVATEEALATVPSEVRQGSLALGATRFQTLWRVILPMASPGILTGFILAMARAAGEVAPLMLTGAVKSAHSLPVDSVWPFIHLERKFMHLGFHIYDMGFQSPNVEASKPLVYLTALVLLVLVFVLNFAAITVRKRMREKYAMKGF